MLATALFAGALMAPAASADRAFSQRFGQLVRGDVRIAANSSLSCPTSGSTNGNSCFQTRNGTGNILDNAGVVMTNVDVDLDIATFNSSTADLTLPAGATVLYAGLYWGADTTLGTGGTAAPTPADNDKVLLKAPGAAAYSTVTAATLDTDSARPSRYQGIADVTAQVQGAGSGTYAVANIQAGTGNDRYGGWALAVAYSVAGSPVKWVGLYDGLASIGSGGTGGTASATLGGFQAPATGTVAADLGIVGYEGEIPHATSESLQVGGTSVGGGSRPTTNPYNASITSLGTLVTTRNPSHTNNLGFDAGTVDVDGVIANNATSATVAFNSGLDLFLPGLLTLVTDTNASAPANTVLPAIAGTVQTGQTLTAGDGTWTGAAPISYTRQWQRCNGSGASCVNIAGATGTTYTVLASDEGSTFRVVVSASNVVGSASATSNATSAATAVPPANTALPTVSGTTRDGQTLTATTGTWSGGAPFTYAYQWRRCDSAGANCVNIGGATSSTYVLTSGDIASTIRVVVTASNSGGSAPATSNQTGAITAVALANTALPTITGTPQHGQTLTASNGTWTGSTPITYAYQWRRCDAAGANCSNIAGATGQTYVVQAADATSPASTIRVVVTATNPGGSAPATSAQTASVTGVAPANSALPAISGTPQHGQTLSATTGTWTGTTPIAYAYQWRRCDSAGANCVNIGGATGSTYAVQAADVTTPASTIRVVVTATNVAGSTNATSNQTSSVTAVAPANTALPTISGTPRHGETLTASDGTWTGTSPIAYAYQWRRCDSAGADCADIAGATSQTYVAQQADVDATIRVVVTATNAAGSAGATSAQSASVQPTPPVNSALPTISGTPQHGQTLTASNGTWTGTSPIAYSYQWSRCDAAGTSCSDISGATGQTYVAQQADVSSTLRVVVRAENAAAFAAASSVPTSAVAATAPVNTALPTISGTPEHGQTLTAGDGTWTGTTPMTFAYQWQRCDASGDSCTSIAGATGQTYVVQAADVTTPASSLRVVVFATNGAGTTPATSTHTASVAATPPVNTALPTVSGTARHGETLSASDGTWSGTTPITYAYQWRRCDPAGANCADIAGATVQTYVAQQADVDATIRVTVTATNAAGSAGATSAQSESVQATPPVNTSAPAVSGTPQHGETLTASDGNWTGTTPITYAYQWRRCDSAGANCADIAGATAQTYVAQQADVAGTVRVVVTATNAADSVAATSAQTNSVAATAAVNTALPAIAGTPQHGQTLTASNGTWTGTTPITYAYQWRRCDNTGAGCADIAGATEATYVVQQDDVTSPSASTIRVVVTATNAAGDAPATSTQSSSVTPAAPANSTAPAITGTARDGETLAVSNGSWSGTSPFTYAYQWRRCDSSGANCSNIAEATDSIYELTPADVDSTIRATVTATGSGGGESATAGQTATVTARPPVNTAPPVVSGSFEEGETLSATTGTWTGTPTISYSYVWVRCDLAGGDCDPIAGATASTYELQSADVGRTVRATVFASNAGGSDVAQSAAGPEVEQTGPVNTGGPSISGTSRDGETLTASNGTWTGSAPITYAHQWRRCDGSGANCSNIAGATGSTYDLTPADVGATVRVVVTATNGAGETPATSGQTAVVDARPPVNTAAPTIAGDAEDGGTLTATSGSWTGTPAITYAYQWQRCDSAGSNCQDVFGATGSSYILSGADVNSTMRVVVTATNGGGTDDASSAASAEVEPVPPVNTAAPTIGGTYEDGQTLTATTGSWTGTPTITHTYRWQRCDENGSGCADIGGATGSTYDLTPADVGHTVRVVVRGENEGGFETAASDASAEVAADQPSLTAQPAISGTARDGQTLTADPGTWTGTPVISFGYRWIRCDTDGMNCLEIPGATGSTYDLTPADIGTTVRLVVTATNAAGDTVADSVQTAVVAARPPVNTAAPAISGTHRDGQTLTATTGSWTGTPTISYAHQWQRCDSSGCADVLGATSSSYSLTGADVGSTMRVTVTATNGGGTDDASSTQTATVDPAGPVNTARPVVSGDAEDGATLSATTGSWTGTPTIAHAYQWQRCDSAGNACANVAGATRSSYVLAPADLGRTMRVVVTATNGGGSVNAASDATGEVAAIAPTSGSPGPSIAGTARDGQTLTASNGTWNGTAPFTFSHQWQRCNALGSACANVAGATATTYVLTPADVGATMRVRVTGTNGAGSDTGASAPSAGVSARPPVNTAAPSVTGTNEDGQTLTATTGTWTGTPMIGHAHQWQRCNSSGAACSNVSGATSSTYVLGPADLGSRMRVVVTATNAGGSVSAASTPGAAVAAQKPSSTSAPTISGTPRDGFTLTATAGGFSGTAPIAHGYQWQRCNASGTGCSNISGATGSAYVLGAGDVGSTMRVIVTGTNAGGSASGTSSATSAVAGNPPVNTAAPVISGTHRDGQTLTSTTGTWTGTAPISYARQWLRCGADGTGCAAIAGATGSTYALSAADVGKRIRLTVTATNVAGGAPATSANSGGPVAADEPAPTAPPAISGTPKQGEKLTATPGTWTGTGPLAHTYRWQRCDATGAACVDIPGADDPTYAPTAGDVGNTIRVVVTATGPGGSRSSTSSATPKVEGLPPTPEPQPEPKPEPKPPVNDGRPTVSGEPKPGTTLTGTPGSWTPAPSGLAYQWERCDAAGANCQPIAGSADATYVPTDTDAGSRLRVTVTATNADGSRTASSELTGIVARPNDLDQIPGSLVGPGSCTKIATGTGVKRKSLRQFGTVKVLLRASAFVSPENPLRLSTSASKATSLKAVRYSLDGRTVGQPKRKPYWQDIKPQALAVSGGDTHSVAVTLVPKTGPAVVWAFEVKTVPCDNILSATQWKTAKGSGLRLRVDSRGALGPVQFKLPATMLPKVGRDVGKGVGRVRVFTKAGPKPYTLKMTKPGKGVLLDGTAGAPRVELTRAGAVVSNLPEGTGIVELTLYTQKATQPRALLTKGKKATLVATTTSAGAPVNLRTILVGRGR